MKLYDLLRPYWKRSDPVVRAKAVRRLKNHVLLERIIAEDPDETVRLAAVETLTDQSTLAQIATNRSHLALVAVQRLTDTALIADVALRADMAAVRELAVDRIQDMETLHRVATSDPDASVRLRARAKNTAADPAHAFIKAMLAGLPVAEIKVEATADYGGTLEEVCLALIKDSRFFINGDMVEADDESSVRLLDASKGPWGDGGAGRVLRFLAQVRDSAGNAQDPGTNHGVIGFYQIKVWRPAENRYEVVAQRKKLEVTHDAAAWSRASNGNAEPRPLAESSAD